MRPEAVDVARGALCYEAEALVEARRRHPGRAPDDIATLHAGVSDQGVEHLGAEPAPSEIGASRHPPDAPGGSPSPRSQAEALAGPNRPPSPSPPA